MIDDLVEKLISSQKYQDKKQYAKLLDRILRNNHYVIPHWNINSFRIIYWNKYQRPEIRADYGLVLDSWWSANINSD